jgi:ribokinase
MPSATTFAMRSKARACRARRSRRSRASGANALLDVSRLGAARLEPGAVLAMQLEVPLATCLDAAAEARRAGALVQVNAAPLPKPDDPVFADLLRGTDVLVVNEGEARALAGSAGDWYEIAARLRDLGPAAVVITLGADGAVAAGRDGVHTQPPFPVEVVDTTGAGDAFCGALAVALADGLPLADAVRRGCAAGAIATTTPGAQSALPTAAELETFLTGTGD